MKSGETRTIRLLDGKERGCGGKLRQREHRVGMQAFGRHRLKRGPGRCSFWALGDAAARGMGHGGGEREKERERTESKS